MALTKEFQSFPLISGPDTKVDAKALPLPKLLSLLNGRFDKVGRISKRFGCHALGKEVVGSTGTLENPDALATFNDELLIFHKQSVYSYSEQAMRSSDKGGCVSASVRVDDVAKNNYQQTLIDVAVASDILLVAWEDSRGGVRITVRDNVTGSELLSDAVANASGYAPRCLAFKGALFVLYAVANELRGRRINPFDPSPLGAEVVISAVFNNTNVAFDVATQDQYIIAAYNVQGAAQLRLHKLNENLAVQMTMNIAEDANITVSLVRAASSKTFVSWYGTGGKVRGAVYDVFMTQIVAPFDIETVANVVALTGYKLPDDTGVRLFYQVSAAASYNHLVRSVTVTNAGAPGSPAVYMRSVGLATKGFAYSPDTTERGFVGVVHESTLQATFFVVRHDGLVVAKMQYGNAGGLLARSLPSAVVERSSGVYQFGILTKNPVVAAGNAKFLTFKGASIATLDFSDLRNFSGAQLGSNAIIVGGVVQSYDGRSAVEQNFHLFPENVTAAESAGGALTASGVYSYVVCYEWTDNRGQLHRSAPSAPVQITLTGGNQTVTLTIPTLRITQKKAPRTDVNIVAYRTESNGSLYYQASSPTVLTYNNLAADTVAIIDALSDATLIGRAPLYTTGDVLENIGPPSASLIEVFGERVWLLGTEDDQIWFSKIVKASQPVEFSDELVIRADPAGGRTTAAARLDDKLIIFKGDSIFYISGDGPNNLGGGTFFAAPTFVMSDVGCVDSRSVVRTPFGLMFKSDKGFYLLGRGLEASYVGAPVEEWKDETVTAAVLVADANEVRFTTAEGPTLVYDYFVGQWSVWSTFGADDAVVWRKSFVAIKRRTNAAALVVQEQKGFFLDIDQSYSLQIGLSWAAFAGVQGLQRVYKAFLIGDYRSPHKLKVSVGYNYQPIVSDEYYWDPVTGLNISAYGDGANYGSDQYYGGGAGGMVDTYQLRIGVAQQKCEALQITVEDVQLSGSCESFSLSNIGFEYGFKRGGMKLPASQSL